MNTQHRAFRSKVWAYYNEHKRDMPWRTSHDLYSVLVSELMLQQTQVSRVIPKFIDFTRRFPDFQTLADAPLADVLISWQGLGYNRRAKFLHQSAKAIKQASKLPNTYDELIKLPGVGKNTAAAICNYAFNQPVPFIETNIRTVFIHEFFRDQKSVDDREIARYVADTLDVAHPREWFWALMDYGSYLKSQKLGSIQKSASYVKQSAFQGSLRQARGDVLRRLSTGPTDMTEITSIDERYPEAVELLIADGLIEKHGSILSLTAHRQ